MSWGGIHFHALPVKSWGLIFGDLAMTETLVMDDQYCISIWVCSYGHSEYVVDAYLKVEGGMKHLVRRYPRQRFTREGALSQAKIDLKKGYFSPRPYKLGQACDGSISACVMSLFKQFCDAKGVNPIALYRDAYQKYDGVKYIDPDFTNEVRFADWEGVAYPEQWDEKAIAGLVESLTEVNNHQLAGLITDTFL